MPMETIMSEQLSVDSGRRSETDESTLADAGFFWRERDGIKVLICRSLEEQGFVNGFSTRVGGVSPFPDNDLNLAGYDEDSIENIEENRRRFLSALGVEWPIATAWQVHGDAILKIGTLADAGNSDERADAVISDLPDLLGAVNSAAWVPVMFGDPATGAFAAVHAGWRGTVGAIVKKSVSSITAEYGSDAANLICAIGPAACGRNYEVGQDVIDAFVANIAGSESYFSPTRHGHALVDLHRASLDQLIASGVNAENIYTAPFCTMERPDLFFSYRLEKKKYGRTGRLLSVIGRR
jgi:YfiH family protein